jgi:hypothetical protein
LKQDFTPCKLLFGVTELEGSSKAENIQEAIADYMEFGNLDQTKLICVVRDGAPNIKKAANLLSDFS